MGRTNRLLLFLEKQMRFFFCLFFFLRKTNERNESFKDLQYLPMLVLVIFLS